MTAPLHEPTAEAAPSAAEEAALVSADAKADQGRSLGRIAWERLKRDKLALTGGVVVLILIIVAVFAPVITTLLGQDPDLYHEDLIDPLFSTPTGSLGGISGDHLLGVEPVNGRDILARILYGARISLLVGFLSAIVAVVLGTVLGVLAGFFGGWVDSAISRVMDRSAGLPAAAVHHRPGLRHAERDAGTDRVERACLRDDPGHRVLRLAVHRTHGARPDALPARAGVRRGGPSRWAPAGSTSCSRNCCPTWWRRSSSTRR